MGANTSEYAGIGPGSLDPPLGVAYSRMAADAAGKPEFSWGEGLTPAGCEHAPPNQGGRYRGKTPPNGPNVGLARYPRSQR